MSDFGDLFKARSHGLALPRECEDEINRFVATHSGETENVERRPFRRQVDFWAFCIATALALKLEPQEGSASRRGKNFVYTSQGVMNDELCSLLAVIAVANLGHDNPEATEIPRIVDLANRLAAAGCPVVLKKLSDNPLRTTPLDRVLEFARSLQNGTGSGN